MPPKTQPPALAFSLRGVSVERGDALILHDLNWRVRRGENWAVVGTDTIELPANIRVGLAFTSHNNQIAGKAVFDSVQLGYGAPPPNVYPKGLVTTSGSVIPGTILAANDTSIALQINRATFNVPTVDVARLFFNQIPAEKATSLKPGRTGVLLTSGDFFDGEFKTIEKRRVKISSVLFGLRGFDTSNEVALVVLRDIVPQASAFEVRTRDGSVIQGKSITIQSDVLFVADPSLGNFRVPLADLLEIKRNTAPPKPK